VHEVARTTTFSVGSIVPATASCPDGEVALGGGWSVPAYNAHVFAAQLTSSTTWSVSAAPSGHIASTTVTAYVECLRGAPGAVVTQRPHVYIVTSTAFIEDVPHCLTGEARVGWAFYSPDAGATGLTLAGVLIGNGQIKVINYDTVERHIAEAAECLGNVSVTPSYTSDKQVSVSTGGYGGTPVYCPAGTAVAGGEPTWDPAGAISMSCTSPSHGRRAYTP
jgi:hypothetical protein